MNDIRRALAWAASDKYIGLGINFVFIAIISRLLTPREIGIAAIGTAAFLIAESLRDFGVTTYVIQRAEATLETLRTTFTLLMLSSAALAALLFGTAPWIAQFYREPQLVTYIHVLAAGFLAGPFAGPILALMRRDMDFGKIAVINVTSIAINAVVVVSLALAGFSYMSIAWGGLASAASVALMALAFRPEFRIYRLELHDWADAMAFGAIASVTVLLNRAYESLPLLVLGRLLPFDAVAIFQRASVVCQLPDRFIMTAIAPVALPAFAAKAREGETLKEPYLRSLSYITVLQWPALIMLAILAHPLVLVLLGPQWLSVVPLVQIMAIAYLVMFPAVLTYPVLVAANGIKDTMWASLISLPLSVVALVPAAHISLEAVALSMFFSLPLQVYVALSFIRRRVPFQWQELGASVVKSALVTACCVTGPMLVIAAQGFHFDIPVMLAALACILAALGWLAGLWLTSHPLHFDLRAGVSRVLGSSLAASILGRRGQSSQGNDKP